VNSGNVVNGDETGRSGGLSGGVRSDGPRRGLLASHAIDHTRPHPDRLINRHAHKPAEPSAQMNFYNSNIGQVGSQKNIKSTVAGVNQSGDREVARALRKLKQAVLAQHELGAQDQQDLLENIEDLEQANQASPEERKRGRIRAAWAALTTAATISTELAKAIDAWRSVLSRFVS
jgi:hypothetical protein